MLMFYCGTKFLFIDVAQKQNYMKDINIYLFLAMRTMASLLSPDMATIQLNSVSRTLISQIQLVCRSDL